MEVSSRLRRYQHHPVTASQGTANSGSLEYPLSHFHRHDAGCLKKRQEIAGTAKQLVVLQQQVSQIRIEIQVMRASQESSGLRSAQEIAGDARNPRSVLPWRVPAGPSDHDERLLFQVVEALESTNLRSNLLALNDLYCLLQARSKFCTNITRDQVLRVCEMVHAPEDAPAELWETAICVQNYAFRVLVQIVEMKREALDVVGSEEIVMFAISRLPLSSAAEYLSYLASASPEFHSRFLEMGLPGMLLQLFHVLKYQDNELCAVLNLLKCFKNEFELSECHVDDIQLVIERACFGPDTSLLRTVLQFLQGMQAPVLDTALVGMFNKVKAEFIMPRFETMRALFLDVIFDFVCRSQDNAQVLMRRDSDIGNFVLSVLKADVDESIKSRSLQIIARIVSYGQSLCVTFSGSELVQHLCNVFETGSFNERVLSLRFFLRLMELPFNELVANLLDHSTVLSFCMTILNSSEFEMIAQVLHVFYTIWCQATHNPHPFYRHLLELFEDESALDCLLEIQHCGDTRAAEAATHMIARLKDYGY